MTAIDPEQDTGSFFAFDEKNWPEYNHDGDLVGCYDEHEESMECRDCKLEGRCIAWQEMA